MHVLLGRYSQRRGLAMSVGDPVTKTTWWEGQSPKQWAREHRVTGRPRRRQSLPMVMFSNRFKRLIIDIDEQATVHSQASDTIAIGHGAGDNVAQIGYRV